MKMYNVNVMKMYNVNVMKMKSEVWGGEW
jgi:hypothetical protein